MSEKRFGARIKGRGQHGEIKGLETGRVGVPRGLVLD